MPRVEQVMILVTILSDQSVVCSVLILPCSIISAHLEPWPIWYQKKYQVPSTTLANGKPKESGSKRVEAWRTIQWKWGYTVPVRIHCFVVLANTVSLNVSFIQQRAAVHHDKQISCELYQTCWWLTAWEFLLCMSVCPPVYTWCLRCLSLQNSKKMSKMLVQRLHFHLRSKFTTKSSVGSALSLEK